MKRYRCRTTGRPPAGSAALLSADLRIIPTSSNPAPPASPWCSQRGQLQRQRLVPACRVVCVNMPLPHHWACGGVATDDDAPVRRVASAKFPRHPASPVPPCIPLLQRMATLTARAPSTATVSMSVLPSLHCRLGVCPPPAATRSWLTPLHGPLDLLFCPPEENGNGNWGSYNGNGAFLARLPLCAARLAHNDVVHGADHRLPPIITLPLLPALVQRTATGTAPLASLSPRLEEERQQPQKRRDHTPQHPHAMNDVALEHIDACGFISAVL